MFCSISPIESSRPRSKTGPTQMTKTTRWHCNALGRSLTLSIRCAKSRILIHHIDDIRFAGPKAAWTFCRHRDTKALRSPSRRAGKRRRYGCRIPGTTKVQTKDAIITIPDEKHVKAVIAAGISAKDRSEVPCWKRNQLVKQMPSYIAQQWDRRSTCRWTKGRSSMQ